MMRRKELLTFQSFVCESCMITHFLMLPIVFLHLHENYSLIGQNACDAILLNQSGWLLELWYHSKKGECFSTANVIGCATEHTQ